MDHFELASANGIFTRLRRHMKSTSTLVIVAMEAPLTESEINFDQIKGCDTVCKNSINILTRTVALRDSAIIAGGFRFVVWRNFHSSV